MEGMLSPADVAVLARNNNGSGSGFGDGAGAWWIIILFLFVFCGWGNGFGNGNGGGGAVQGSLTRGDLCMDMNFQELQNSVRNISDGVNLGFANLNSTICNQQYDTARMINGVDMNIMQGNFGLQNAINGVSSQIASCCCDVREGISGINYNAAMNTNAIQQTLCNNTRDMIENCNANYRALHDEIVANRIEDKNAQITAQQNEINALRLAASQQAQNNYLVSTLRPTPEPSYIVPNPFTGFYGYNNGCGCNTFNC